LEKQLLKLLQQKINRANAGKTRPIFFSPEEVESAITVIDDLTARIAALEKENTSLSLFGFRKLS
jgi:hypothetical protein